LWNNKFEWFDRTILMLYYRMLGRRIAFTAHNVNAAERDGRDGMLNRLSLKIQYRLANHIFVHTERMRADLMGQFGVGSSKISVIPFGINNTFPRTNLTMVEAKRRLGLEIGDRAVLFFGQIAPYKGLEYLVTAMSDLIPRHGEYRLVIAGKVKRGHADYWERVERKLTESGIRHRVIERVEHIPDDEVELYFKAADVVVIPYMQIFQSGVPFLAYSFGLPIIATDVGSLRHDVMEGITGFICRPGDPASLAQTLESYFCSELYRNLEGTRQVIKAFANERYSWTRVGEITEAVYTELLAPS
jgi:glycosyltransferase involved in cell wall biosynthesis